MSDDVLPDCLHDILDDFECALSLPLLLLMVYFTMILAIPLISQVYTVVQSHLNASKKDQMGCRQKKSFLNKITGIVGLSMSPECDSAPSSPYHHLRASDSRPWTANTQISDDEE